MAERRLSSNPSAASWPWKEEQQALPGPSRPHSWSDTLCGVPHPGLGSMDCNSNNSPTHRTQCQGQLTATRVGYAVRLLYVRLQHF